MSQRIGVLVNRNSTYKAGSRGSKVAECGQASRQEAVQQFLHLCLHGRWDATKLEQARALAAHSDFNWDAVCKIARAEGIAPLIYRVASYKNLFPPSIEQAFRLAYFSNVSRNTRLFHDLEEMLHGLAAEGIPVILLKGAGLSEAVYRDIALRPLGDLDLLLRRQDVPAALHVLGALGYATSDVAVRPGAAMEYENEFLLHKTRPRRILVEVHWALFDSPYYQRVLPMEWFWQTALPTSIDQAPAWVLGPEAQVLHLCGHLVLHHGGQRWLWLHDVAEVLVAYKTQIDWDMLLAQTQQCGLVLPLQQVLPCAVEKWGAPLPHEVLNRLRDLHPSREELQAYRWLTAPRRPVAQRFYADLGSTSDWRRKLRYAWDNLFPSAAYMQQRYRIRHPFLLPLYYPYRWFLGLRSIF